MSTLSPLPASDYTVRAACPEPQPGQAQCLALQLIPRTAAARAHRHPVGMVRRLASGAPAAVETPAEGAYGERPADFHAVYDLPADASSAQTIAIVDAYNDPDAEADLGVYDREFGLPECTVANGCLSQVSETGETARERLPAPESLTEIEYEEHHGQLAHAQEVRGWILEISMDVETAHEICQNCRILLVEAKSPGNIDFTAAEATAERLGASEVSDSWGGPEAEQTTAIDNASPFNDPGVVITASSGDDGYLDWKAPHPGERGYADYPATSPHVVAVGGTRLYIGQGDTWGGESAWNDSLGATGGGCSAEFAAPGWQTALTDWSSVGCGERRASADIAADADPDTGAAVYDSAESCYSAGGHWCTVGGTSLSSPLIAAAFALAGGSHGVAYPAQTLYERAAGNPALLHDVRGGSNASCATYEMGTKLPTCSEAEQAAASHCTGLRICLAGEGYDGPTGLGTPDGLEAFTPAPPAPAASTGSATPAPAPAPTPTVAPPAVPVLSAVALLPTAIVAFRHVRANISALAFSFTLSAAARVQAVLYKRVRVHGRWRWQTLADSLTITASRGHDRAHLTARGRLAQGTYRLTLTPAGGIGRSLTVKVG